jgi:pimeloyl-ACP methyl ester carboxylesterase
VAIGTYVLVHGAWHGGWCWAKVARLLRDAGHEVHTPTLTGLGERAHLARPEIDLELHVQDLVAVLETEELRQVTLVGHSYGGMVVTGAAARLSGRIGQLVYLDAFVPEPGKSVLDYVAPERAQAMRDGAHAEGEGWKVPPFPPERFGVTSQRDTEWLNKHLVPQPLRTLEQPLPAAGGERLKRSYIYCSGRSTGSFEQFAERLRDDRKWTFHEVKTGHDAMVTAPGEVARILMGK